MEEIRSIKKEAEQVNRIYDLFQEENRLTHSRAAGVEFLFYTCEKPEMLGRSNHLLFVGRQEAYGN